MGNLTVRDVVEQGHAVFVGDAIANPDEFIAPNFFGSLPEGKRLSIASESGARADVSLSYVPGEVRRNFVRDLSETAEKTGISTNRFLALVGAKAHALRDSFGREQLREYARSGSAILAAVSMLSSPALAQPSASQIFSRAPDIAKEQMVVHASREAPDNRIYSTTPTTDEVFSGSERYQGTRGNCTFYATCRALEEVYEKKLDADTPERLWALYRHDSNPDAMESGSDLSSAVDFVCRSLDVKSNVFGMFPSKESIMASLKKGDAIVLSVKDAWSPEYKGQSGQSLSGTLTASVARPNTNPNAEDPAHAICVLGYDKGKKAFIVANSWVNAGNKGYLLIDENKLLNDVIGVGYSFSKPQRNMSLEGADMKKSDPYGEDISFHRSTYMEAIAHSRVKAKDVMETLMSAAKQPVTEQEKQFFTEKLSSEFGTLRAILESTVDMMKKESGMEIGLKGLGPIDRAEKLALSGDFRNAKSEMARADEWIVREAGSVCAAAGNIIEAKSLDAKDPWKTLDRIDKTLKEVSCMQSTQTEDLRIIRHSLDSVERKISNFPEPERTMISKTVAEMKPLVESEFSTLRKQGTSNTISDVSRKFASDMDKILDVARNDVFDVLDRKDPKLLDDPKILMTIGQLSPREMIAFRDDLVAQEKMGKFNVVKSMASAIEKSGDKFTGMSEALDNVTNTMKSIKWSAPEQGSSESDAFER